jgi:predicted dehydrogenase
MGTLGTARITESALLEPARHVPDVTVTGVAARDKVRAEAFALRHALPAAYGSYDELLADPDIDAVYNPLPNSQHGPWTLKAIAAGKHVLCEKPFASNTAQAEQVAAAASASGLVVMEAMHYRYHPLVQRLRELVAELGPVRHLQCWTSFVISDPADIRYDYDLAGGALMDGGCYAVDCLRLLGGGEPSVSGALADPWPSRRAAAGEAADRATAVRLTFGGAGGGGEGAGGGGATGWFESAFTRDGDFRADVHVSCRDGQVRMQNFILAHEGRVIATRKGSVIADERASGVTTTYAYQLRAFAAAIEAGPAADPVPTSAAQAVATMRVIDDAYRASGLALRP